MQIVDLSNAPFARPDLKTLLNGIRFIKAKDYPVRRIGAWPVCKAACLLPIS